MEPLRTKSRLPGERKWDILYAIIHKQQIGILCLTWAICSFKFSRDFWDGQEYKWWDRWGKTEAVSIRTGYSKWTEHSWKEMETIHIFLQSIWTSARLRRLERRTLLLQMKGRGFKSFYCLFQGQNLIDLFICFLWVTIFWCRKRYNPLYLFLSLKCFHKYFFMTSIKVVQFQPKEATDVRLKVRALEGCISWVFFSFNHHHNC